MKSVKSAVFIVTVALFGVTDSFAVPMLTYGTHMNPYETSARTSVWDQNIESESGAVAKSGSWSNFSVGSPAWAKGTWLFSAGSYVQVAFSVIADTLYAQLQSDTNDGIAEFWVDGSQIGSVDTYNRGWFQAKISGLTLGTHTMRIYSRTNARGQDDLSFDNFGAVAAAEGIPEPTTLALLGLGLAGIGFARKKKQI